MSNAAINLDAVPAELRERNQWVLWKRAKGTKVPVSVRGASGDVSNPETWGTFEQATAAVGKFGSCGFGFVISDRDPYTGVDLDHCIRDGELLPWAREILDRFKGTSYAEVSPSGEGIKLLTRGRKPKGSRCSNKWEHKQGLECYCDKRFWTVTSEVLEEEGFHEIGEGQEAVDWLVGKYLSPPKHEAPPPRPVEPSANGADLLTRAQGYVDKADPAKEGERNTTGFRLAGHLAALEDDHGGRLSDEQVLDYLRIWNVKHENPLPDAELQQMARNGRTKGSPREAKRSTKVPAGGRNGHGAVTSGKPHEFNLFLPEHRTEAAAARRVAAEYAGRIRWCDPWGKWLVWDAKRWKIDDELRVERAVKKVAAAIMEEAKQVAEWAADDKEKREVARAAMSFAKTINSAYGVRAVVNLARSEPGVPIRHDALDAHPMLLNVANGTLDLTTGTLRPHRREDLLTKLVDVEFDEDARCPTWRKFLGEVFEGNTELIGFIRRAAGYSLTASTNERCLFFLHGKGKNGKTTLVSTLQKMLGDYAGPITTELLMTSKGQAHPTELTDLAGCRMAVAVETEDGRRMAESFVKQITGGEDVLKARRMREDFWSFMPSHKLWVSGNHKPRIRGTDDGIWDRIRLIPFNVRFSNPDRGLPGRLEAERPGILAWCVAGCLEWQAGGLGTPGIVEEATAGYRREMDVVGQFLDASTEETPEGIAFAGELYRAYCEWCKANGEFALTQRIFGAQLTERFGESRRGTGGKKVYQGIILTSGAE